MGNKDRPVDLWVDTLVHYSAFVYLTVGTLPASSLGHLQVGKPSLPGLEYLSAGLLDTPLGKLEKWSVPLKKIQNKINVGKCRHKSMILMIFSAF